MQSHPLSSNYWNKWYSSNLFKCFAEIHLPIISGVSLCILEFVSVTVRVEDFIFLQGLFCYNCIGNSIHKSIVTDITMHNSHIKDIQIKEWNYIYLATPSKSLSRPSTTVGPAVTPSFSKTGDSVWEIPIEIQIEFNTNE